MNIGVVKFAKCFLIAALPFANAGLNSLSTGFLIAGFIAIRNRQYTRHMKLMFAALASSTLFFICYVIYHHFRGNTPFLRQGLVRPVYFFTDWSGAQPAVMKSEVSTARRLSIEMTQRSIARRTAALNSIFLSLYRP